VCGIKLWIYISNSIYFYLTNNDKSESQDELRARSGSKEIYSFTGGTHMFDKNEADLERTLNELGNFGLKLMSPCHCTGFQPTAMIWNRFPDEFVLNHSGKVIEVPDKNTNP